MTVKVIISRVCPNTGLCHCTGECHQPISPEEAIAALQREMNRLEMEKALGNDEISNPLPPGGVLGVEDYLDNYPLPALPRNWNSGKTGPTSIPCVWDSLSPEDRKKPMMISCPCPKCSPWF